MPFLRAGGPGGSGPGRCFQRRVCEPVTPRAAEEGPHPQEEGPGAPRDEERPDMALANGMGEAPPAPLVRLQRSRGLWQLPDLEPCQAAQLLAPQPPGSFVVTGTAESCVLSLRTDSLPGAVGTYRVLETPAGVSLDTSQLSFPDLPQLLAFLSSSRYREQRWKGGGRPGTGPSGSASDPFNPPGTSCLGLCSSRREPWRLLSWTQGRGPRMAGGGPGPPRRAPSGSRTPAGPCTWSTPCSWRSGRRPRRTGCGRPPGPVGTWGAEARSRVRGQHLRRGRGLGPGRPGPSRGGEGWEAGGRDWGWGTDAPVSPRRAGKGRELGLGWEVRGFPPLGAGGGCRNPPGGRWEAGMIGTLRRAVGAAGTPGPLQQAVGTPGSLRQGTGGRAPSDSNQPSCPPLSVSVSVSPGSLLAPSLGRVHPLPQPPAHPHAPSGHAEPVPGLLDRGLCLLHAPRAGLAVSEQRGGGGRGRRGGDPAAGGSRPDPAPPPPAGLPRLPPPVGRGQRPERPGLGRAAGGPPRAGAGPGAGHLRRGAGAELRVPPAGGGRGPARL
uniref:SH2 domain-containing protein n=1 Tax=Ornithorhynchus anatinus TaxID=9258 RepID=A0A6I8NGM5_ORNAN